MQTILALDLARVSGLAFRDDAGGFRTATLTLGPKGHPPADNYVALDRELTKLFELTTFDLVTVENDTGRGGATTRTLRGYHTAARIAAARFGIPTRMDIGPSEARKLALGSGGASKEEAAGLLYVMHGFEGEGPDEADAVILLIATERKLAVESVEREARAKLRRADAVAKRARKKAAAAMEKAA